MGSCRYTCRSQDRRLTTTAESTDPQNHTLARRSFLASVGACAVGLMQSDVLQAALTASPGRPSTSRASRREAVAAIPFNQLAQPLASRVRSIVDKPTIYRRLPIQVIPCHPQLFVYLVRYPEIIVNMWQLMGVTKVEVKRSGPYKFRAKDGAGTVSDVQLVYGTRDLHLFLAEGYYDGPLAPRRVTGRCILMLSAGFSKDASQQDLVSTRLDVFVQLDNAGVEVLAKTLHPFLGRTADSNFHESTRFLSQVSQVCQTNGPGVQRLCPRLTAVDPQVRTEFAELAAQIRQQNILRSMRRGGDQSSNSAHLSQRPTTQQDHTPPGKRE